MSIFGSIMHKIFHTDAPTVPVASRSEAPSAALSTASSGDTPSTGPMAGTPPSTEVAISVDVGAVLESMAQQKGGGGDYQSSIVDLLKLLDLDSSLAARKELAGELDVHAGADGSAEENIALHHAVMEKLAENGGKVPANLKG